jgi:hypothetical protein
VSYSTRLGAEERSDSRRGIGACEPAHRLNYSLSLSLTAPPKKSATLLSTGVLWTQVSSLHRAQIGAGPLS